VELATGIAQQVVSGDDSDVALFVPFPYLEAVQKAVGDKVTVGAEVRILTSVLSFASTFLALRSPNKIKQNKRRQYFPKTAEPILEEYRRRN